MTEEKDNKETDGNGLSGAPGSRREPWTGNDMTGNMEPNTPDDAGKVQGRGKNASGSIWIDVLALLGGLVISRLVASGVVMILNSNGSLEPEFSMFVLYTITFGLTIVFALWLRWRRTAARPLLRLSLKKTNPALVLWGLILTIVTSVAIEPILNIFPSEYLDKLQDSIGTGGWAIVTSVVAAPILEEVLFRGILQESLTEKLGGWRGVLAASAVFGIVHIIPQQMINAFFIGIILGYIYIKTRSLLPVILIHAINNALAFIQIAVFGDRGHVTTREAVGNDTVYWIIYGICCAVFIVALVNLHRQLKTVPAVTENRNNVARGKI